MTARELLPGHREWRCTYDDIWLYADEVILMEWSKTGLLIVVSSGKSRMVPPKKLSMQQRNYQHAIGNITFSRLCMYLSALLIVFVFSELPAAAAPAGNTTGLPFREAVTNMTQAQKEARMAEIQERVKAIKAMDKSGLTKDERKTLRLELRRLHTETMSIGHRNLFISIGAVVLVIVMLIIILH